MTVEAEEEMEVEEETNTEAETVSTSNGKGKEADAEDKDATNYHEDIATGMVAAHTAVSNASSKEPGTKTPPPFKTCREAAP